VTPAAVGIYSVEISEAFTRENAKVRASFDADEGVGGDPKRPASEDRGGGRFLVVRVQKFTARRRLAFLLGGRGDPAAVSGFSLPASFNALTCGALGKTAKTHWRSLTGQTPKRAGSTGRTGKRAGGPLPPVPRAGEVLRLALRTGLAVSRSDRSKAKTRETVAAARLQHSIMHRRVGLRHERSRRAWFGRVGCLGVVPSGNLG
jgi:hypothetical protein